MTLNRRQFLRSSGAVALTVAIAAPWRAGNASTSATANAYLRFDASNRITAILPTSEMGQGTHTGQLMILGEELGVEPSSIAVELPIRPSEPYRLFFGQMRSVGSYGIRAWHDPLRKAAAQARSVLLLAASDRWNVPLQELDAVDGHVVHASTNRRLAFGELVEAALALPLPADPPLRPASERRVTGRALRRVDTPAKVDGTAVFGTDVDVPEMLHGAVRMNPVFGGAVSRYDVDSVADLPGVEQVVPVPNGVVVVADTWWRAKQAADALDIEFGETPNDALDSTRLSDAMREGFDGEVPAVIRRGDAESGLQDASRKIEATYEVPFLTHICMEPIVCTAHTRKDHVELWMPTQGQDIIRMTVERVLGFGNEQMTLHTTYLGGGFGRKTHGEIAEQAMLASRAVGRPVKVMWSREDDIQQGYYRPIMMARLRASLNQQGRITAMHAQLSGPQMGQTFEHITVQNNNDMFSVASLIDQPYTENFALDHRHLDVPMPLSPWRAVSSSQNGYFLEAFLDELAHAANQDPVAFRRAHYANHPRHLAVLNRVAEMARWDRPAPAGRYRGVAVVASYGSVVAQVVTLRMVADQPTVEQVHVAIDCGRAINPDSVEAQMRGSVIEGLAVALRHEVPIADGRAQRSNFHDYAPLRIDELPEIEVGIVDTGAPLGGVGEPGIPPVAPALVNAIFQATGERIRRLPLSRARG
ncbi:MAG: molybdopterin-dependent oxidoreductase [Gammaproteobacteria bacterium]|nr:molybdopterin-dependent oxidoreductase [Gammaproteobacteria bacterium]